MKNPKPAYLALVLLFVITGPVFGQAEIDDLRKENSRLKSEARKLEKMLERAEKAGFRYTEKGYSSALEILKDLPKDLRVPTRGKWQQPEWEKLHAELASCTGTHLAVKHRADVTIKRTDTDSYSITFKFQPVKLPYRGKVFGQYVYPITIQGNEKDAKHASTLNGRLIAIEGVITSCTIHAKSYRPGADYHIDFKATQRTYSPPLKLEHLFYVRND